MDERRSTLDDLDPPAWGDPSFSSHLVTTCHALRKKPVGDFETADLRIMIGQAIGLQWLVPLALDVLEKDPWAAGDLYAGDLLAAMTRVDDDFWNENQAPLKRLLAVLAELDETTHMRERRDMAPAIDGLLDRYGSR